MEGSKKKGCGGCCKCPHPISQSVGELVLIVTRSSFSINAALPYGIWGSIYSQASSYGVVLQPYLPTGVTVTSANTNDGVLFTYTQGLAVDTIRVTVPTIGLISYLEVVNNLKTNYMSSCLAVFNCNAANNAPFLSNEQIYDLQSGGLYLQKVGATGDKSAELIIPTTRRQLNNSIPNVIEIYLRNTPIKAETVWVHQFPWVQPQEPPVPLVFQWTVFFSERFDANENDHSKFSEREPSQQKLGYLNGK